LRGVDGRSKTQTPTTKGEISKMDSAKAHRSGGGGGRDVRGEAGPNRGFFGFGVLA